MSVPTATMILHCTAEHGHRIGVVEENRTRTIAFDIAADVEHERNVAQCTEYARNTACVTDVGVDAVLFGDQNIVLPYVDIAVEYGTKHTVSAL